MPFTYGCPSLLGTPSWLDGVEPTGLNALVQSIGFEQRAELAGVTVTVGRLTGGIGWSVRLAFSAADTGRPLAGVELLGIGASPLGMVADPSAAPSPDTGWALQPWLDRIPLASAV